VAKETKNSDTRSINKGTRNIKISETRNIKKCETRNVKNTDTRNIKIVTQET
jgi:hypothetical protein